ncbi:MAG: hypothetical protein H7843_16425, partial [Nitrospirota bacterium]
MPVITTPAVPNMDSLMLAVHISVLVVIPLDDNTGKSNAASAVLANSLFNLNIGSRLSQKFPVCVTAPESTRCGSVMAALATADETTDAEMLMCGSVTYAVVVSLPPPEFVGKAGNQLPQFIIEGVIVSDDSLSMYTTIVINTATKAVSYYDGFNFNSYGRPDSNTHLAANANGIYVIDGDLDDGQPIACTMQTGLLDFGIDNLKQCLEAYFHAQAVQAPVALKV